MAKKKIENRGGARDGAGRKKGSKETGTASFRMDLRIIDEYKRRAKELIKELESGLTPTEATMG